MFCSRDAVGKCQQKEPLAVYISLVIPEALVDLYSPGCCCFMPVTPFAAKDRPLEGPKDRAGFFISIIS
jgi:hypothetical protein